MGAHNKDGLWSWYFGLWISNPGDATDDRQSKYKDQSTKPGGPSGTTSLINHFE